MKNPVYFILLLLCPVFSFGQVGIGTTTPHSKSILDLSSTSKGLLIPRMTYAQRLAMSLTAADHGMMVFQTDVPSSPPYNPVGLYTFDGTSWCNPVLNASTVGSTMRWDGAKWSAVTNLFNQGSSIGIGTTAPKSQLHLHSSAAPVARLQITNSSSGALTKDGLIIGMNSNKEAFINQQESRSLFFAVDTIERVRIDSIGNVGINKINPTAKLDVNGTVKLGANGLSVDYSGNVGINRSAPAAKLDVNGTVQLGTNGLTIDSDGNVGINETDPSVALDVNGSVKLGQDGTPLTGIIRISSMLDVPVIPAGQEIPLNVPCVEANVGATVLVSPGQSLTGIVIGYAMVSAPGVLEIKFTNMSALPIDLVSMMYYVTLIQ